MSTLNFTKPPATIAQPDHVGRVGAIEIFENAVYEPVMVPVEGVYIDAFTATGTITNRWGIYQAGASENNYFAGPVGLGTSTVSAAFANLAASTTARASLNIPSGTAPSSPTNGDIWSDGSDLKVRLGGVTYTLTKA